MIRRPRRVAFAPVLACLLLAAGPAAAQPPQPGQQGRLDDPADAPRIRTTPERQPRGLSAGEGGGFFLEPTVSVTTVRDTNLFYTPGDRTAEDWITRVSPAVQAGYRNQRGVGLGWYTFDAERYQNFTDLTRARTRDSGGLDYRGTPTERLTLTASAGYAYTTTPYELTQTTGFVLGRVAARRIAVNPSFTYAHTPRVRTRGEYAFTRDQLTGSTTITSQIANAELRRDILAGRGTLIGAYTFRDFAFDAGRLNPSHVVGGGLQYALTPRTSFLARGAVRFTAGGLSQALPTPPDPNLVELPFPALLDTDRSEVTPEWNLSLTRRAARYELEGVFLRTQATAIGLTGVVDTTAIGFGAVARPAAWLDLRAAPGFYRDTFGSSESRVFRATVDATGWVTSRAAIVATYQYSLQQGRVGAVVLPGTLPFGDIRRQQFTVGVLVTAARRASSLAGMRGNRP
jgi:hypothetical protein